MGILVANGCSYTYGDELPGSRSIPLGGDTHHHHTFTYKLAEKLGVKYVNLAHNGASNQKIFRTTTTFLQQTSKEIDRMVLTWSSWGRLEVYLPMLTEYEESLFLGHENCMNQIIPNHYSGQLKFVLDRWRDRNEEGAQITSAREWYKNVYNPSTAVLHHLNYMCIMQDMCDLKGIKIVQGIIHHGMYDNLMSVIKNAVKSEYDCSEFLDTINFYMKYLRPECKIGFGDKQDLMSICESSDDFVVYPMGHPCENTHTVYADLLYEKFKGLE